MNKIHHTIRLKLAYRFHFLDHFLLPQPRLLGMHPIPFSTNHFQFGATTHGLVFGQQFEVYIQTLVITHQRRHLHLETLDGGRDAVITFQLVYQHVSGSGSGTVLRMLANIERT